MEFTKRGKMFAKGQSDALNLTTDAAGQMMKLFESSNMSYHFHHKCLTDEALKISKMDTFYRPLSYSYDKFGKKFISIMEAIDYPFFAVQFHPEKIPFEFVIKQSQHNIPHSIVARAGSRYLSDYFIGQARLNSHRREKNLNKLMVYRYHPMYTGILNDMYEQRYLFPFVNPVGHSTEEFLDYVPDDDEEAPENISSNQQIN